MSLMHISVMVTALCICVEYCAANLSSGGRACAHDQIGDTAINACVESIAAVCDRACDDGVPATMSVTWAKYRNQNPLGLVALLMYQRGDYARAQRYCDTLERISELKRNNPHEKPYGQNYASAYALSAAASMRLAEDELRKKLDPGNTAPPPANGQFGLTTYRSINDLSVHSTVAVSILTSAALSGGAPPPNDQVGRKLWSIALATGEHIDKGSGDPGANLRYASNQQCTKGSLSAASLTALLCGYRSAAEKVRTFAEGRHSTNVDDIERHRGYTLFYAAQVSMLQYKLDKLKNEQREARLLAVETIKKLNGTLNDYEALANVVFALLIDAGYCASPCLEFSNVSGASHVVVLGAAAPPPPGSGLSVEVVVLYSPQSSLSRPISARQWVSDTRHVPVHLMAPIVPIWSGPPEDWSDGSRNGIALPAPALMEEVKKARTNLSWPAASPRGWLQCVVVVKGANGNVEMAFVTGTLDASRLLGDDPNAPPAGQSP